MLKKLSIKARLIFLFLIFSSLLLCVASLGLYSLHKSNESLKTVYEDRALSLLYLTKLSDTYNREIIGSFERFQKGRLSAQETLEGITFGEKKLQKLWRKYLKTKLVTEELEWIADVQPYMDDVYLSLSFLKESLVTKEKEKTLRIFYQDLEPLIHRIQVKLSKINELQVQVTQEEYEKAQESFKGQRLFVSGAVLLGIFLALGICLPVIRTITGSLKDVSDELAHLAKGNADLSKRLKVQTSDEVGLLSENVNDLMDRLVSLLTDVTRSDQQVATLCRTMDHTWDHLEKNVEHSGVLTKDVLDSTQEISTASEQLVETMRSLSSFSREAKAMAFQGQKSLKRLDVSVNRVEKASFLLCERLLDIREKASNIHVCVTTITKVADRTQLLSLNAAIEAEKAGEYGLGFSIVAQEIRRLADQAALSVSDIEQIVEEMKKAVQLGVEEVQAFSSDLHQDMAEVKKVGAQLSAITDQVRDLNPSILQASDGAQIQAKSVKQINEAMDRLKEASIETKAALKDSWKGLKDLQQAMEILHTQVSLFRLQGD